MSVTTSIVVTDGNEHTIEIYTGEDEPVVTVQKPGVQVLQLDERLIIFDETTGDIVTFDGENWLLGNDGFGEGIKQSSYAVVGTAIVGKDVVGPSEPPTKTVLIPQTTFTAEDVVGVNFYAYDIPDLLINEDKINVVFDGVKYENLPVTIEQSAEQNDYYYGGDATGDDVDFSVYPFVILSSSINKTSIFVQDGNEHTIEVYIEE